MAKKVTPIISGEITSSELSPYVVVSVVCDRIIPVPIVDDYVLGLVRNTLFRQIVHDRSVTIDGESLRYLAWGELTGGVEAVIYAVKHVTSLWEYIKQKLDVLSLGEEAIRTYAYGILFDHYVVAYHRRHITLREAKQFRKIIEDIITMSALNLPPMLIELIGNTMIQFKTVIQEMIASIYVAARSKRKKSDPSDKIYRIIAAPVGPFLETSQAMAEYLDTKGVGLSMQLKKEFDLAIKKSPPWGKIRKLKSQSRK